MLDPQIIPQKWGGNLWTKSVDIQSSLLGIDRPLTRDCMKAKYKQFVPGASRIVYPECDSLTTDQSRVTAPAWMYRDLPQDHSYILPDNPQVHTEMKFSNYVNTRIFEKDNFRRDVVCPANNSQDYTKPFINDSNKKEGFKNSNIDYARQQFDQQTGTSRRHVK